MAVASAVMISVANTYPLTEKDWEQFPILPINQCTWPEYPLLPQAQAQLCFLKEQGLILRLTAQESSPRAVFQAQDDPVYQDSCLEAFLTFSREENSPGYMNLEVNSNGAFLAALGTCRENRTPLKVLTQNAPQKFSLPEIKAFRKPDCWGWESFLSLSFIEAVWGKRAVLALTEDRGVFWGNFYKCGDKTDAPHYLSWSPIETPAPDFHRPEQFGVITLSE